MDRMTLEYMGKRVDKAREIIGRIENLQQFAEYIESKIDDLSLIKVATSYGAKLADKETIGKESVQNIAKVIAAAARKEIERLEQELAEL